MGTVEIEALKAGYQNQLNSVSQNIAQLQNQIKMLADQREQLKGAIYALDQALAVSNKDSETKEQSETKEG